MPPERHLEWETVVGLEVHCELRTRTKLLCSCPNTFGDEPNTNVCPVCLGLPGSLPVLNAGAVELAMKIGTALQCRIVPSIFHRKNYFYPDMPKDYQVSQYDEPINVEGWLELADGTRIGIVRAHMEEDTGKSTHVGGSGRLQGADHSLIDYNRAGVPLVEIVSEPDLRSADQARAYVSELRSILVATGASDGKMEEGSLRVDANVSVRRSGTSELGTRCEVKNMNSLRSLARAVDYEADRQISLLEGGQRVLQETRHWNEAEGRTTSMRSKEEAEDYRYFPEPDLVPVAPDEAWRSSVERSLPVLPSERRSRLAQAVGSGGEGADASSSQVVTLVDQGLDDLVLGAIEAGADPRLAANRAANEGAANAPAARGLDPSQYAALLTMEKEGRLSATQAKAVLVAMLDELGAERSAGGTGNEGPGSAGPASVGVAVDPVAIAARLGFEALSARDLDDMVDGVLAEHPDEWSRYVAGEDQVAKFLVGQVMRATRGKADGKAVTALLAERRG